jgi:opacity protein-like surface antigen
MDKKLAFITACATIFAAQSVLADGTYSQVYDEEPYVGAQQIAVPVNQVLDKNDLFDGFYLGLGLGVGHTSTKSEITVNDMLGSATTDTNLGKTNFDGNIFLGYGSEFDSNSPVPFYIGAEIFGRYNPVNIDNDVSVYHAGNIYAFDGEFKNNYSLGIGLKGGVLLSPKTMIYILLGMDYAQFTYNEETAIPARDDLDFNVHKYGFMPGLGIETMLTDHLSLRAEYTYTFYGVIEHTSAIPVAPGNSAVGKFAFNSTARGLFNLGLTYHFNCLS